MSAVPVVVAAFDFDGTLTRHDTVVPFLRRLTSGRRLAASLLPRILRLLPIAARRDRDRLREIATELVFTGRPAANVATAADLHAAQIIAGGLRDDTVARLHWHTEQGHRTVVVSASYEDYLRVVGADLGVDGVVGTRLEVVDGVCTGRLDGGNCRGPEKVRRLEAWLDGAGLARADIELYAYGDSAGDRELLAWADHATRVNAPLTTVAPSP